MYLAIFWTNAKRSWANFFWIYDDRTCFSMNQYLGDEGDLKKLSAYLLKRNRVLLGIYLLFMLVAECILWKVKCYSIMWMLLFGGESVYLNYGDTLVLGKTHFVFDKAK